jgi:serine/threonine-protein kinase
LQLKDLDPARFARLSALLDEALALAPEAREAWLAALSTDDPELKRLTGELLTAHSAADADALLETRHALEAQFAAATGIDASQVGKSFGPYRILRELGHGGMGAVWLAERADGLFSRQVALKLLHTSLAGTALTERFARERAILAALNHPHIARLLDAGFSAGQPYLALEYVEGVPLTTYCDERRLPLRTRIELMLQVLSAVQHAHRNLVIHRDLKPSNILVTPDGQVSLLDFGIAKLMRDGEAKETELTQFAGRALTPEYASPEQIAGAPITTASDVYALGVVLYELLCGSRPYALKRDSRGALEEAILAAEPIKASQSALTDAIVQARATTVRKLRQALSGDLDTILGKALKKDPVERYATADAFLQDLQRYLAGEPVSARPDSAAYRLRKLVARNRFAVAAVALIGVALASATAISLWQARLAREQATLAAREAKRAQAVQGFLLDIFKTNTDTQPDPLKARQTTARNLLDIGARRVGESLRDSPEAQLEVLGTLGSMYWQLGLDERAADMDAQAIALLKRTRGPRDREVAGALLDYAEEIAATSRRGEIPAILDEAQEILDALGDQSEYRGHLLLERARLYSFTDVERSLALSEQTLQFYQQRYPTAVKRLGAVSLIALGHWLRGEYDKAETQFVQLVALINAMDQPEVAATIATRINLAAVRGDRLKLDEAERELRQIAEESRRINGAAHLNTVTAQARLGALLHATFRRSEARALLEDALAKTGEGTANDLPHVTTLVRRSYGVAMLAEGRIEAAEQALALDVAISRANYPGSMRLGDALRAHGAALSALGRYGQAQHELDEGYVLRRTALGASAPSAAMNAFRLEQARLALARGDPARATENLDAVAPPPGAATLPLAVDETAARVLRAQALLQGERPADAEASARQALAHIVRSPLRDKFQSLEADAALRLGQAQQKQGDPRGARPNLERALELRTTGDTAQSPWLAEAQIAVASCLIDLGQHDAARALLARAGAIQAAHPELGSHLTAPLHRIGARLASR